MSAPANVQASRLFLGGSVYRLSAPGSGGYHLRLSTYRNDLYQRISLIAENDEGEYARYNVKGTPSSGRIDARFPGIGTIEVSMHSAKTTMLPAPNGCERPRGSIESGEFVGQIRLRGEGGFTKLVTNHAHGVIERKFRQACSDPTGRASLFDPFPPPTYLTVLRIESGTVAVNAEGEATSGDASFEATARESRGGMGIVRGTGRAAAPESLEANLELTQARVAPPLPFLGSATYSGPPRGTGCSLPCPNPEGQLEGSLRVALPGIGVVPLAGPGVKATLYEDVIAH